MSSLSDVDFINYHGSGAVSGLSHDGLRCGADDALFNETIIGCAPSMAGRVGKDSGTKAMIMSQPGGMWVNTHFHREGNLLHLTAYLVCGDGADVRTEIFKASVDLQLIEGAIRRFHNYLHRTGRAEAPVVVGFSLGDIGKAVSSIGKNKLVKSVTNQVKNVANMGKSVIRSPITGAVLSGAAVVFPPVGAPALAAYGAANVALSAMDKAQAVKSAAQDVIKATGAEKLFASSVRRQVGEPLLKAQAIQRALQKGIQSGAIPGAGFVYKKAKAQKMALMKQAQDNLQKAKADARKLLPQVQNAKLKQEALKKIGSEELRNIQSQAARARNSLMKIAVDKKSPDPAIRYQAEKAARIVSIVNRRRKEAQNIARSAQVPVPGAAIPRPGLPSIPQLPYYPQPSYAQPSYPQPSYAQPSYPQPSYPELPPPAYPPTPSYPSFYQPSVPSMPARFPF